MLCFLGCPVARVAGNIALAIPIMKYLAVFSCLLLGPLATAGAATRSRDLFDFDWKFYRGDAPGAEQTAFQENGWKAVNLPHDWAVERIPGSSCLFDQHNAFDSGSLPGGVGWYRKSFTVPADAKGKRAFLEFDGAYMNSEVWINGAKLGARPYGYVSFAYELTDHILWGQPNLVAVRCQVDQPCSRWYSGAGIFRHVWLTMTEPVHVAHWGTTVTTSEIQPGKSAKIHVQVQVQNQGSVPAAVDLKTSIVGPEGKEVASQETVADSMIPFNGTGTYNQLVIIKAPVLWDLNNPALYKAVTEVRVRGKVTDRYETPFGIRTIEFTKDNGFLLNGKRVQIQGVCLHHDQGPLGSAAYDRAIERQLEVLKSMGCNAIRTSHNPPAPALLDCCDRMGFVVMDEAFDEWKHNKTKLGYGRFFDEWSERDIVSMLHRDRNHPSVVLWSIGNEIPEQSDKQQGGTMAKRLADICHREDPTRLVTSACSNPDAANSTGFAEALDVFGINYKGIGTYKAYKGRYNLIASESSSQVSSRGEYNLLEKNGALTVEQRWHNQVSSYDIYRPSWALQAEQQLKEIADAPWVAGEFVWTGFDYIGEPTPFRWPAVSSYFGIVDLCGFPKDRYYLYQSRWMQKPMVHILPHWNWSQFAGKPIPVWAYANADSVELFLNGKSLGVKSMAGPEIKSYVIDQRKDKKGKINQVEQKSGWYHVEWMVPYQPGTLKAVARRGGKIVATDEVATTGKPARIELKADRKIIKEDGQDLAYVTVRVLDAQGRVCPDADNLVKFSLSGPGKIAGVGNGNSICHEDFQSDSHSTYHGLCLAILQSSRGKEGVLNLTASADGLKSDTVAVTVK